MAVLDVGRVCIKTRGREAGAKVVVVGRQKGFVVVDGLSTKRRRCNPMHLMPLDERVAIKKGATHEEVAKILGK